MPDLIIREATADDASEVVALYQCTGIESGESFTPEEAGAHFAVFARYPNYQIFVAVLGHEIVGTYELLIMNNLAKRGRPSGVVEDVAVSPKHQGIEIGRALMEHAREVPGGRMLQIRPVERNKPGGCACFL
jgi:ribosomal protein S18 acetylase RimI-like enzyme